MVKRKSLMLKTRQLTANFEREKLKGRKGEKMKENISVKAYVSSYKSVLVCTCTVEVLTVGSY